MKTKKTEEKVNKAEEKRQAKAKKEKEIKEKLAAATFLDKEGNKVKVSDLISEEQCWYLEKTGKYILTHDAIKTIARKAGISMNFSVEESPNIVPDYRNELEHIVRVTIHCKANAPRGAEKDVDGNLPCVHSEERTITITGEANTKSTPNRGRAYLRKMAEKRAFDIAVLEHLGLYTSIFSEEESPDFENADQKEATLMPGTKEFESVIKEVNAILKASSLERLQVIASKIKRLKEKGKYSDAQSKYLRELYQRECGKKYKEF